jgi:general stress protein 26
MPSRRDLIAMTPEEAAAFLDEEKTVVCATNGKDGWPHLMPLWFVRRPTGADGADEFWAWTFAKSQKVKNLERDPRASLQVEAGTEYHLLRGVMLECDTEIVRDTDRVQALGLEIFGRYAGVGADGAEVADEVRAMVRKQAEKRVGLRFVERRRVTWDHRKLGGVY